jgi:cytoskeletal protein RodZ
MATLGQQLKYSREEKGISLHQIADTTHIGVRFLQAIENDTYDILPGGVFNRAFVRKFAKQVGLDEEQAIKLYEEQLEEQGGEPERRYQYGIEDFEARPSSGNGLLLSFVALLILGALAYAAYQYFTPMVPDQRPEGSVNASTPTPTPEATPTPSGSPVASPSPEMPAGVMRVELSAPNEECWVSVTADGQKSERFTLQPGETRTFDVNNRIILSVGRVQSLKVTINGRAVNFSKLLRNPNSITATDVVITKDNYQQFLD